MSLIVRNALGHWATVVSMAVLFLAAAALTLSGTAEAQSHTAIRSFSAASVEPGGLLEVSVSAEGYGAIGQVVETLPEGFVYRGSDQPEATVSVDGQTVAFTLFQSSNFTYVVSAPAQEGVYAFTGTVKDQLRQEQSVTGAGTVRVGAAPTLEPTIAPTEVLTVPPTRAPAAIPTIAPTPAPTSTPTPTAAPTAAATASPTQQPTDTPAPTSAPASSATAARTAAATPEATETARPAETARPTPTPTRRPTATTMPTATPTQEPAPPAGLGAGPSGSSRSVPPPLALSDSMDDLPTWVIGAIVGGIAALFVAGLAVIFVLARRRREDRWRYSRW